MTLRLVDGTLQKAAHAGGRYIPSAYFNRMLTHGRETYAIHHCPDCAPPHKGEHHPTHFHKEDVGTPPNPRHWTDRGDDD